MPTPTPAKLPPLSPGQDAAAAALELYAALLHRRTELRLEEWVAVLAELHPRTRRVVILHGLLGIGFADVGERLGLSRGRADQLWRAALHTLRRHPHLLKADRAPGRGL